VPFDGCGSKKSCSVCASVDNILVIQSDETITESWDTARRITCSQSEVSEKTIYFKPFVGEWIFIIILMTSLLQLILSFFFIVFFLFKLYSRYA
jgi:hypothetical protein